MALNATQKKQLAASVLLGAVVCGACMAAMPVLWPALLGAASHGLLVMMAALSGAATLGYDAYRAFDSEGTYSARRAVGLALVLGLAAVPLMSALSMGLAHLTAALKGIEMVGGFTFQNVCNTMAASHAASSWMYKGLDRWRQRKDPGPQDSVREEPVRQVEERASKQHQPEEWKLAEWESEEPKKPLPTHGFEMRHALSGAPPSRSRGPGHH